MKTNNLRFTFHIGLRDISWSSLTIALLFFGLLQTARAQTIPPPFTSDYSFVDLGSAPGLPSPYGGITFVAGDPNTLLIGGAANVFAGAIYAVGLIRDAENHITGFSGTASFVSTAPYIDGGLAYGPGGVLFYTGYPDNSLGEIKPGSSSPDKIIDLTPLGIFSSVGTLQFIPAGFPDTGGIRIASYDGGGFYSGLLTPDGMGTFDFSEAILRANTGEGPEGIVYVPAGAPVFTAPSILISEYLANQVSAYDLDQNGIPIPSSRRAFIIDLTGAEGAVLDPLTNDFLFSTFGGGDRVIAVRGFPAPQVLTLTGAVSRKSHGGSGDFDLPLVLDPASDATVEPRSLGSTQIIFTFSSDVVAADGTMSANEFIISNASFKSASVEANSVTLNLTDVVDQAVVTIALTGIEDTAGNALSGDNDLAIRILLGDVDQDRIVDKSDYLAVKAHAHEPLDQTSGNYLFDVNLNGNIGRRDARIVWANQLHSVP